MYRRILLPILPLIYLAACQPSSNHVVNVLPTPEKEKTESMSPSLQGLLNDSYLPLKTKTLLLSSSKAQVAHEGSILPEALLNAQKAYIKQQQNTSENIGVLNQSKDGIDYLLTATAAGVSAMGISAPAAIAIEITNKALNQALEYGIGELERKSQEEASKILADRLKKISAQEVNEFEALKGLKPEQALVRAEKMVNGWIAEKDLSDLPQGERAEARAQISTWVARTALAKLAENQSANDIIHKGFAADIQSAQKNLLALNKTLKQFAKETSQSLEKILSSQESIAQDLLTLSDRTNQQSKKMETIAEDLDFLKTFAFSRMTAREQLSFLKNRPPKGLAQEAWNQKVSLIEKKIEFEENYQRYFNGAKNLITIASNLGVNSETVQSITEGVEKIDRLKSGVESITQGSYLAGIATLSGLLGGRENAEAAKHRAIIARLDRVLENQTLLSEQIQTSFKIQVEALNQLSNQLRQSTEVLYLKMDKIHNDVLGNRALLANLVSQGLKSCELVSDQIKDQGFEKAFFTPSNFKNHLSSCSIEYDKIFGTKERDFSPYFSFAAYKSPISKEVFEAEEGLLADSLDYLSVKFRGGFLPSLSLKNPSENAFGLIQKSQVLSKNNSYRATYSELSTEFNTIKTRYFSPGIVKNVQRMIAIFPAINIWTSRTDDNLFSPKDLLRLRPQAGKSDIALIDSALDLVNVAIQQETLLSGDILLSLLREDIQEVQNEKIICEERVRMHPRCLLKQNSLLFRNFINFNIYKDFFDRRFSLASYKQALANPDDLRGLKALLSDYWNITWNKEKALYEGKIAGLTFEMPRYEDVVESQLSYSETLPYLLRTREDLVDLKTEMNMNTSLSKEDRSTIYRLFAP